MADKEIVPYVAPESRQDDPLSLMEQILRGSSSRRDLLGVHDLASNASKHLQKEGPEGRQG